MKHLSADEARSLAIKNPAVMSIFSEGYSSVLTLTNSKVMNDKLVRPNNYWGNEEFDTDPQWFAAYFPDKGRYYVLRALYVRPDLRGQGAGSAAVRKIQEQMVFRDESFLQVGVQVTSDGVSERLFNFYSRLGFKKAPSPVDHGGGIHYQDLFWASKPFTVLQDRQLIVPKFT